MTNRKNALYALLPLAILLLFALVASAPYLSGRFPLTADGVLHYYRAAALDYSLSYEALWPRYTTALVFGYGSPVFNYYAPTAAYPQVAFYRLGLPFPTAYNWGFVFYSFIAALGMYLWAKTWSSAIGGLIAAAGYVFAPYLLYDALWRGTISEYGALALLPWLMWAFHHLIAHGQRRYLILAPLLFVAFAPMHNITTLYGTGVLGLYSWLLIAFAPQRRAALLRAALGLGFGLALSAFFWWPALAETGFVRINEITAELPFIDVVANLQPLAQSLELPRTADPSQLQFPVPITLSWLQIGLGLLALWFALRARDRRLQALVIGGLSLVVAMLFMTTEASAFVWRAISLLRYSQFPWRWLGTASLILALLSGIAVAQLSERLSAPRWRYTLLSATTAATMLYALPWTYVVMIDAPPLHDVTDIYAFEAQSGQVAAASYGEYQPLWNAELPDPQAIRARYDGTPAIPRLLNVDGVTIERETWGARRADLRLSLDAPQTLVFEWLFFPGWYAALDGQPLTVYPIEPYGFVAVDVPAGEHDLQLWLGQTETQSRATALSIVAALMLAVLAVLWPRLPLQTTPAPARAALSPRLGYTILVTVVAVFALKALWLDNAQTPIKRERFTDGVAGAVDLPLSVNFNQQLRLLGADMAQGTFAPADELRLTLYWQLQGAPLDENLLTILSLRNAQGAEVLRTEPSVPGGLDTSHWLPGYYVADARRLTLPSDIPPATYTLLVEVYNPVTGQSLDVLDMAGYPQGVRALVGQVVVDGNSALSLADIQGEALPPFVLGEVDGLPAAAQVGDELRLSLQWGITEATAIDYSARLLWLDGETPIASTPPLPLVTGYPTSQWRAGDVWRGHARWYVPAILEEGAYTVALQLMVGDAPQSEPLPLAMMDVTTPPRIDTPPAPQQPIGAVWENGIVLVGYDSLQEGDALQLTLYWRTDAALSQSLRRFVHVLGENGGVLAVVDGVPVDWTRPTTGWTTDEYVVDTITLPSPQQAYTLLVGWYAPDMGVRISVEDGDALPLR